MSNTTVRKSALALAVLAILFTAAVAFSERGDGTAETDEAAQAEPSEQETDPPDDPAPESAEDDESQPEQSPRLDVAFVVDATGSMADEIEVIKKEVWSIANEIASGDPTPDVRFGLVFYRDRGDDFVVRETELTRDIDAIHEKLMAAKAAGGGDGPEHVLKALDTALDLDWEEGEEVSRSIYLVGDAAAHTDYDDGLSLAGLLQRYQSRDIAIQSIGCSGIENTGGREQFARLSRKTSASYENLTYHAVVEGQGGEEKSVVYEGGEHYEADEALEEEEWSRGAAKLKEEGRLEPASSSEARKAKRSGDKENNLDSVVSGAIKDSAKKRGVSY